MGWGDNRKSPKMRRRRQLRKHKARVKRQRELRQEHAQRKQGQ